MNYYNEWDKGAARWLRNLIAGGLLPPGDVDERSISEVKGSDIDGYTQCHFFAGIGGWSLALNLAAWPASRPVWTGSCPCQPFSVSGKRLGEADERHLWPEFLRLIDECRPATVFGEQVASSDGRLWLAGVRTDLEALGYAVGAADLCAAGVAAPHIRQRLYWVADSQGRRRRQECANDNRRIDGDTAKGFAAGFESSGRGGWPGNSIGEGLEGHAGHVANGNEPGRINADPTGSATTIGSNCRLPNADMPSKHERTSSREQSFCHENEGRNIWGQNWIPCADGKTRRLESGIEPLAHGVSKRMVKLRGYGNAIVPQVGAEFIGAFMDYFESVENA